MSYNWRTVTQTVPIGGRLPYFPGNANRVSLLCAPLSAGSYRICYANGANGTFVIAAMSSITQAILTYRDYGSAIQTEVWIENASGVNLGVAVTELYRIPGC